ncbi:MAG: hypothetical protein IJM23_09305 [Lachnospiraceae bacterium]|nr:hypothetical protein [Lachnospiraceae bacterium]
MPDKAKKKTDKEILKEDELLEEAPVTEHLKTKPIPAIIMLLGGSVSAVYTYIQGRELKDALIIIFVTLLIFLILGEIIKLLLDRIEIVVQSEEKEDGDIEADDDSMDEEDQQQ